MVSKCEENTAMTFDHCSDYFRLVTFTTYCSGGMYPTEKYLPVQVYVIPAVHVYTVQVDQQLIVNVANISESVICVKISIDSIQESTFVVHINTLTFKDWLSQF